METNNNHLDAATPKSNISPAMAHYLKRFDPEFIYSINPFWFQFDPPSSDQYIIFSLIYLVITIVGVLGNGLVICIFKRFKTLRTSANTLVCNLAVADLLMIIKCPMVIYNNYYEGPALGDYGCRIYGFLGGVSGSASIFTLCAIAIERCYVVAFPLRQLSYRRRPVYIIGFIWLCSFLFSIIPVLNVGYSKYAPEGYLTTCSFDYLDQSNSARVFMFSFFIIAWYIPLLINGFCYFFIFRTVLKPDRVQSNRNTAKREQKLALTIVVIIGLWFLAWTPYSVTTMLGVFGKEEYITPLGSMIPAVFCKSAACIDPYVYAGTNEKFRAAFLSFFRGKNATAHESSNRRCYLTGVGINPSVRISHDVIDVRRHNVDLFEQHNLEVVEEVGEDEEGDDIEMNIVERNEPLNMMVIDMEENRF